LKILFVTTISNTINAFLIPHIELLVELGHEVDIACNIVREIDPKLLELGCKVHKVEFQRSPLKKDNYIAYKKIKKLVLSEGYELIHTHTPVASFLTRLACRNFTNVKVLYTAHGFHFYKGAPLKNWILYYPIECLLSRWTDGIITINNEDLYVARKMSIRNNGKVFLIPGIGTDLNRFNPVLDEQKSVLRTENGFKEEDFLLINAAEINKNKNQKFLIKGMSILKKICPNIKLLLAGDGEQREKYEKYVLSLNLQDDVIFLGYRQDLDRITPMCDVGVSASLREGLGMNIIEYMACGLPVVATKNRGHNEIIIDGINGFLFESTNINQFVELVRRLYKEKALKKELGKSSIKTAQKFSLDTSLEIMDKIYRLYI
jgi:glycosyltransferase EpsD